MSEMKKICPICHNAIHSAEYCIVASLVKNRFFANSYSAEDWMDLFKVCVEQYRHIVDLRLACEEALAVAVSKERPDIAVLLLNFLKEKEKPLTSSEINSCLHKALEMAQGKENYLEVVRIVGVFVHGYRLSH